MIRTDKSPSSKKRKDSTDKVKIKPFKGNFSVKEIQYRTRPNGFVMPLIVLHETAQLRKNKIGAIAFQSVEFIKSEGLSKGSKVKVEFDHERTPIDIITLKKCEFSPPHKCASCERGLVEIDGEYKCENNFCAAKPTAYLFTIFKLISPMNSEEDIKAFITKFPVGETPVTIDNLYELKYLLQNVKSFGSQIREDRWKEFAGADKLEKMLKMENELITYLKKPEFKTSHFWAIMNFPLIREEDFFTLSDKNPESLIYETKNYLVGISSESKKFVKKNLDQISWLIRFIKEMSPEVKWVN